MSNSGFHGWKAEQNDYSTNRRSCKPGAGDFRMLFLHSETFQVRFCATLWVSKRDGKCCCAVKFTRTIIRLMVDLPIWALRTANRCSNRGLFRSKAPDWLGQRLGFRFWPCNRMSQSTCSMMPKYAAQLQALFQQCAEVLLLAH